MLSLSILLFCFGLALSAIFSGSETAFYRAPKIRMKLDTLAGDRTATQLLWLMNRPDLFVATVLVGNNLANYAVALSTVLFLGAVLPLEANGIFAEIVAPLLLAPLLFVYGEMFPKYIAMNAPNRMLRFLSPVLMFCFRVFIPVTIIIWLMNRMLARFFGQSREVLRLNLGRQELTRMLEEGRETGILSDAQRRLADGIFRVSDQSVREWTIPQQHWPTITTDMKPAQVLEIARKWNLSDLPVYESDSAPDVLVTTPEGLPVGYVRVIDLEIAVRNRLDEQARQLLQLLQTELPIRSMVEISGKHTTLTAMILMQTLHGSFGCVLDEKRSVLGFVQSDQLRDVLLGDKRNQTGI